MASKIDFKQQIAEWRTLDPQKIWEWPAVPRVGILSLITLVLAGAGYYFFISPENEAHQNAVVKMEQLKEEYKNKYTMSSNLAAYKKLRQDTEVALSDSLKQLPSKSEMEALLNDIHQAGLGRGLNFELLKPAPKENLYEFYAELPIQLKVNGSYHDIAEFNAAIARLPRIVTINDVELTLIPDKDAEKLRKVGEKGPPLMKMQLSAIAKIYRYLDESEVKEQQKLKALANKNKPPAPPAPSGGK